MDHDPDGPTPDKPGVNGLRFSFVDDYLYYTSTAQELLMRLRVDPLTCDPAGEPECVAAGMMGDDFCLDENSGLAYIATHRENTIDRVSLTPSANKGFSESVAGDPISEKLIGPSSGAWGRGPGEYGRVAFFTSDGGTKSPPDGVVRTAKVLGVEF